MIVQHKSRIQLRGIRSGIWRLIPIRPSFTLVELLVVIVIIGLLAGMTMIALAGAKRDAEVARTRNTIEKINKILYSKYREVSLATVPLDIPSFLMRPSWSTLNQRPYYPISGRELARTRLIALRHLLRFELPDRSSDFSTADISLRLETYGPNGSPNPPPNYVVTLPVPIQNSVILDNLKLIKRDANGNPVLDAGGNTIPWDRYDPSTLSFPDAKLLYQIVAASTSEESSGLESFHATEIGDPDEDGNPEFIDAWGTPIRFLRWPAGAWRWSSIARKSREAELYSWYYDNTQTPPWIDEGISGGDRLDPVRADWRYLDDDRSLGVGTISPNVNDTKWNNPYDLAPLVVSAGADREFGLIFSGEDIGTTGPNYGAMMKPAGAPASGHDGNYRYPDPFFEFSSLNSFTTQPAQIGDPISQAFVDNISSLDAAE